MIKYLETKELGKLPVRLSYMAFRTFEEQRGVSILSGSEALEKMKMTDIEVLLYEGLKSGFRKDKRKFEYAVEDIQELLEEEPSVLVKFIKLIPDFIKQFTEQESAESKNSKPLPKASKPQKK